MLSKHLFVKSKFSIIASTSFGFARNRLHDFPNTVFKSWWHCLRQMLQKTSGRLLCLKKGVALKAKRFDTGQPAQSAQANLGR